jgi:hypothetical protein
MNGVAIQDDERRAWMTIFDSPKAKGETQEVGLGDDVQGYTVSEITDTTLTLTWNDLQEVIDMADTEPPKQTRVPAKKVAALNIIRIGSKITAVETTTESSPEEEGKGLQVGVVGGQSGGGSAGRSGAMAGRRGLAGQQGVSGARGLSRGGQGRGLTGAPGLVGGAGQGTTLRPRR